MVWVATCTKNTIAEKPCSPQINMQFTSQAKIYKKILNF